MISNIYNHFTVDSLIQIPFTLAIYEEKNELLLNFKHMEQLIKIKFEYQDGFNFSNFSGQLKLKVINLSEYMKCLIRKELEQPDMSIAGIGYDINIQVLNFENFLSQCYNLFIKIDENSNNFIRLRTYIQKTLDLTLYPNDKMFGEFILNHYLHKLYSEIGLASGKQISTFYYLMTKPGYNLLVKILIDKINNDLDKDSNKKINGFCNNKNKYYQNLIKFFRTKLGLDEIQFKNHLGKWVNLPMNFIHTYNLASGDVLKIISPKIVLDTCNDSNTLVSVALIDYFEFQVESWKLEGQVYSTPFLISDANSIDKIEDRSCIDYGLKLDNRYFDLRCPLILLFLNLGLK